jgi:small membrane protein
MIIFAQVFLLSLVVFAMGHDILRYRQNRIHTRGFLLWLVLWFGVIAVIMFPNSTVVVARFFGIGRGTDLVLYTSIILILYFLFRIYVHLEQVDREITQIVRTIALRDEHLMHSENEKDMEINPKKEQNQRHS